MPSNRVIVHSEFHEGKVESRCESRSLLQQFAGAFLRDVNLGVLVVDAQFCLADISGSACQFLGCNRETAIGQRINELFGDMPSEYHLVQRSLLEGAVVRNQAVSWMNGRYRYDLLMDSNVLRNEKDEIEGAYVIFKDITNLRTVEEQVYRNDRLTMIGQIAAGAAHEIRNPLTSIKGFIQLFKRTFARIGLTKEIEHSDMLLSEINRINEILSEFLLLSKPKQVSIERLCVRQVWELLIPLIQQKTDQHHVQLKYSFDQQLQTVAADRELLRQVFLHMTMNAIEAMADGGILSVDIRSDEAGKRILIFIRDTGPGIPSYLVDKIFDPFFTTKAEGKGLGLSVCQRVIHDIGGMIRVSSKGYGTTFTVSIPY